MFKRGSVTSTFVERVFAPMTQWTSLPKARLSLPMLAALHATTIFEGNVKRWWRSLATESTTSTPRSRDPAAVLTALGSHTCAWHEYAKANCPQDAALSSLERHAVILKDLKEWKNLAEEHKTLWKDRASTTRRQAASRGAPVEAVLALQAEGDVAGGGLGPCPRDVATRRQSGLCRASPSPSS